MENRHKLPQNFAPASVIQSQSGTRLDQLKRCVKISELYHATKARFVVANFYFFLSFPGGKHI